MPVNEILQAMNEISFFKDFNEEEKQALADGKNYILHFKDGDYIIRQGETDTPVFVLLKGRVVLTRNQRPGVALNELEKGAVFGKVSLVTGSFRLTNAVAKSEVIMLKADKAMFETLEPEILDKLQRQLRQVLIGRLDQMNLEMADLKAEIELYALEGIEDKIEDVEGAASFPQLPD